MTSNIIYKICAKCKKRKSNFEFPKGAKKDGSDIKQLLRQCVTQKQIAQKYNVNQDTISDIKREITWGWVK